MFVSLVNSQIASVLTGLNQLNLVHLRTHLVCSEIIYTSSEKVHDLFLKFFKDLCTENQGKLRRKIQRQRKIEISEYVKFACTSKNVKTFYLLRQQK